MKDRQRPAMRWQLVAALATSVLVVMGSLAHAILQAQLYS